MTVEEAIIWLNTDDYASAGYGEALAMAIKALEKQPCEDAISREDVLDELDKYIDKAQSTGTRDDFISFQELVVKSLPSVTPSYNSIKTELKPSGDYISREEALKVMCDKCPMYNCITGCSSYRHIEKMPSVTPQPKVGHWVEMELVGTGVSKFSCSVCKEGDFYNQIDNPFIPTKYCPNCGADMRGEDKEWSQ